MNESSSPPLPAIGQLDLARRLDIVASCVDALRRELPSLVDAEQRLAEYEKSTLAGWCAGIAIVATLLGQYLFSWFYVVAIFAAGAYVQRSVEVIRFEYRRDQGRDRVNGIRTLWATSGLFSTTFEALNSLWRESFADASLDSDEYEDWWREASQLAEAKVRSALR